MTFNVSKNAVVRCFILLHVKYRRENVSAYMPEEKYRNL